jgi:hypothetical protein
MCYLENDAFTYNSFMEPIFANQELRVESEDNRRLAGGCFLADPLQRLVI